MTRTAQLTLLLSVIIVVGMSLMGCTAPAPAVTPPPGATGEPPAAHLTTTAQAAAVQTIDAALAAEGVTPAATETPAPVDVEATAQALARLYVAQTASAAAHAATATPRPPARTPTSAFDAVVNTSALNLRAGPGTQYPQLGQYSHG